jgi:cyclin C
LLLSEIGAQLVVHHPYTPLKELHEMLNLTSDEHTLAWSVINDHYVTDLPFLYPPHVVAAAAVSFTLNLRPSTGPSYSGLPKGTAASASAQQGVKDKVQQLKDWLITSGIDVEGMVDCTQEIISMYVVWEQYSERDCRDQINRFVKGRGLDR